MDEATPQYITGGCKVLIQHQENMCGALFCRKALDLLELVSVCFFAQ